MRLFFIVLALRERAVSTKTPGAMPGVFVFA
jgi:hypothetical protein